MNSRWKVCQVLASGEIGYNTYSRLNLESREIVAAMLPIYLTCEILYTHRLHPACNILLQVKPFSECYGPQMHWKVPTYRPPKSQDSETATILSIIAVLIGFSLYIARLTDHITENKAGRGVADSSYKSLAFSTLHASGQAKRYVCLFRARKTGITEAVHVIPLTNSRIFDIWYASLDFFNALQCSHWLHRLGMPGQATLGY